MEKILLAHGSGGKLQNELIQGLILKHFNSPILKLLEDSAVTPQNLAFTTDSYVVKPIFFAGGNIGKLAIAGTVNDLLCSGAHPAYISLALIIEEGFEIEKLETILESAKLEADAAGIELVCGDLKVVENGKADQIYINTAGIGFIKQEALSVKRIKSGDKIIISGTIGDHGITILSQREGLKLSSNLTSDCASLTSLVSTICDQGTIHCLRDPTRGGLGGIIAEIAASAKVGIEINEEKIPILDEVRGACELLGLDPLYIANEGKVVAFVDPESAEDIINLMHRDPHGKDAAIIGEVTSDHPGLCLLLTQIGGKRIIDLPAGELLPRIC